MALIKCPECGKEISDKANTCPNCGCPIEAVSIDLSKTPSTPSTMTPPVKKKKHGCLIAFLIIIGIPALIGVIANMSAGTPIVQKETTTSTSAVETTTAVLSKEDAQSMDEQIWNYIYPVITANNDLMAIVSGFGEGTNSELDVYNAAKDFEDYARKVWSNPPSISDEYGKKYLDSCRDYIIIEQTMANSLLKYLDSKKTSDLSKLQENIERCTQAVQIAASNRGAFLGMNGFTDEEINTIVENTMQ